jgi:hypothetical protein
VKTISYLAWITGSAMIRAMELELGPYVEKLVGDTPEAEQ